MKTAITITVTKLLEKKNLVSVSLSISSGGCRKLLFLLPSKVEADRLMNRFGIAITRFEKEVALKVGD